MLKSRVLIVEDEEDVATLIKHVVERHGEVEVEIAARGDTALRAVAERRPDLIVLDLNLPVLDGVEVCRILRSRPETRQLPIVVVSARTSEDDRVKCLELGADDYITKPFSLRELSARIRTALRRTAPPPPAGGHVYAGARMTADFDAMAVSVSGEPVRLTRREFELLRYLVTNKNRVVSRDRLLEQVWGYDHVIETRSVDVHVGRLRHKLGPAAVQIETVVGLGYRFID
jgi:two-component system phosphate regulon response regulator PhoB